MLQEENVCWNEGQTFLAGSCTLLCTKKLIHCTQDVPGLSPQCSCEKGFKVILQFYQRKFSFWKTGCGILHNFCAELGLLWVKSNVKATTISFIVQVFERYLVENINRMWCT